MNAARRTGRGPWNRVLAMVVAAAGAGACDQSPRYERNVQGVFGETGMGPGEFSYPRAVATAADGTVFIVDKTARIQRFNAKGEFETGWRMPEWKFGKPVGLAVHPDGRIFVADTHYSRVMIYDRDGKLVGQFGEKGEGDGQFLLPTDVAFDGSGRIYVAEYGGNDRISVYTPDGRFLCSFGGPDAGKARLQRPAGLVFDDRDQLWVADACNHRICRFSTAGKLTFAFGSLGTDPGQLRYPYDLTRLADGTLLVCEFGNNRLQRFSPDGRCLDVWGSSGREIGQLAAPWGVDISPTGLVYVVDSYNNRVQILDL